VQDYNTYIRQFPVNLTAMMFGYKPKPNFTVVNEAQIQQPPTVDVGQPAAQPQPAPQQPPAQQPAPAGG
jgi:LemA protein